MPLIFADREIGKGPAAVVVAPVLQPTTATPVGTVVATIQNVPVGVVPMIDNDDRFAVSGDPVSGYSVVLVKPLRSTPSGVIVRGDGIRRSLIDYPAPGGSVTPPTPSPLMISGSLTSATVGTNPAFTPTIVGGTPPYTLSLASGTLPPGRALSGLSVTGTYSTAGSYSYTLRVTDSGSPAQTADLAVGPVAVAAAAVIPLLQGLTDMPVAANSLNADQVSGQAARFKVTNSSSVETAVSTAAQAQAAGAVKVTAVWDNPSASWWTFSTPLDYSELNGLVAPICNAGAQVTLAAPAAVPAAYTALSGFTVMQAMSTPYSGATTQSWLVAYTGTTGRYVINHVNGLTIAPGGRINTGDALPTGATPTKTCGTNTGAAMELFGARVDHATGIGTFYRWGEIASQDTGVMQATSGSAHTGPASAVQIRIQPGQRYMGTVMWAKPVSDADAAAVGQRMKRSVIAALTPSDCQATYWRSNFAGRAGYAQLGFSMFTGTIGVWEFDAATRLTTDVRLMVNNVVEPGNRFTPDDHNEFNMIYSGAGSCAGIAIGHSNSSGSDTTAARYAFAFYSATGRVADYVYLGRSGASQIGSGVKGPNYCMDYARGANEIGYFTVDDVDQGIVEARSTNAGATLAGWTWGRKLVAMAAAPGGGQAQQYDFGVQPDADTFVHFIMPHASNFNSGTATAVAFKRAVTNLTNGDFIVNGTVVGNGRTNVTNAALVDYTALPSIYIVPADKSARILSVSDDGLRINFVLCTASDGSGGVHMELRYNGSGDQNAAANWTARTIAASGAARDAARRYFPDLDEVSFSGGVATTARQFNDGTSGANGRLNRTTINAAGTVAASNEVGPYAETMNTVMALDGPGNLVASFQSPSYTDYLTQRTRAVIGVAA